MAKENESWWSRFKKDLLGTDQKEQERAISAVDSQYGYDSVSVSVLLGSGKRQARTRTAIYQAWNYMAGDPLIETALRLHVTMALGGHETSGQTVFIEETPAIEGDKAKQKVVSELKHDLESLFNRISHQTGFNAAAFGDAYGRAYLKDKVGLIDVCTDEMVWPPLVQPYEKGSNTVGYIVSSGDKFQERLTTLQLSRCKMPRLEYVPQVKVIDKAMRAKIKEDDIEKLPITPSLVGGSFLYAAEEAYWNYCSAINGLVNQRILGSIDENLINANLEGMTVQQKKLFMTSLKNMLQKSKDYQADLISKGAVSAERRYHIMPTSGDKQLSSVSQFTGTSGASSISIEDVMFHAKLLAGSLGIDISMLGFADILSGGLGEGGFFRTSAQAAERSMIIRTALTDFFNNLVDLHTFKKYGWVFDEGDRPYRINFYGSISALENETASSQERAMNATSIMVATVGQLKDLGLSEQANEQIMTNNMKLDEETAKLIAGDLAKLPPDDGSQGGFGGGGFGQDKPDFDKPQAGLVADEGEE